MSKQRREVTDKKHKIRRAFLISTIAVGLLTAGVGALAMFSATPIMFAIDVAALAAASFVMVGTGVSLNKIRDSSKVSKNKKIARTTMEHIKTLDKDRSSKFSQKYRAKIVKKYANANLTLCKRRGGTLFGVFHSSSGIKNENATAIINSIDAYTLLRDASTSRRKQNKYSKKIALEQEKLTKIIEDDGLISAPYRWTKSYDNVVDGVSVLDRRTEIACLTSSARDAFVNMFANSVERTDNKALNVILRFGNDSNLRPTMIRAEDQTKVAEVRDILLKDVIEACKNKSALEVRSMFPITIESRVINKTTTKILKDSTVTFDSLAKLKSDMETIRTA